jgi:hypothetical protein
MYEVTNMVKRHDNHHEPSRKINAGNPLHQACNQQTATESVQAPDAVILF